MSSLRVTFKAARFELLSSSMKWILWIEDRSMLVGLILEKASLKSTDRCSSIEPASRVSIPVFDSYVFSSVLGYYVP